MLNEIFLAIIQAITEFLPVSSSGHLALFSNLFSEPNLFFFTALHIASLIAVLIFTRREIYGLLSFNEKYKKLWIYVLVGIIPAGLFGYFFNSLIENTFSSLLVIGMAFMVNGMILLLSKFTREYSELNVKNSFIVGMFQILALFPGISRSGTTISSAMFQGVDREQAFKFSFLMFIPLSIGAFILESGGFYFDLSLAVAFLVCLVLSLVFLNLLYGLVKKGKFWVFSFYSFFVAVVCFVLWFLG